MELIHSKDVRESNVLSNLVLQHRYGKDHDTELVRQDRRNCHTGRLAVPANDEAGMSSTILIYTVFFY